MSILLVSLGGGGGNILRSLKTLFRRDLLVTQKSDPKYAERLKRAICTRFIDTNEFSLSDVPRDERLLIGARTTGRLGARHNPEVARQALGVLGIGALRHRQVAAKQRLQRAKNVSAAAAQAQ